MGESLDRAVPVRLPESVRGARWLRDGLRSDAGTITVLVLSVAASLVLGFANLGVPSLWHDELVHVYVAKSLVETGAPRLPSGEPYFNGTVYHLALAATIALGGLGETVVRTPSAIVGALNILLVFFVVKPLLGRNAALVAAIGLALSPWAVAWSREARFYTLQQSLYLIFVGAYWRAWTGDRPARTFAVAGVALLGALLTSYHSALFLAVPAGLLAAEAASTRRVTRRLGVHAACLAVLGCVAVALVFALMNTVDRATLMENSGLGGALVDSQRNIRFYYPHWLHMNLSTGFFVLACAGFLIMIPRERSRGLYALLAFWLPVLALTFLVGYRRPRFMFFAYPFFVAAWAYALVCAADWIRRPKPGLVRKIAALTLIAFFLRLGVSGVSLVRDSLDVASGAHTTLARRHPQWKKPAAWVRANVPDAAVLTTTFLPVLHYVGRVDNWYPSRGLPWEANESGMAGLPDTEVLSRFMADHPHGVFLAEWWRFERNFAGAPWADFSEDIAFVHERMRRIEEASSDDVTVYVWGAKTDAP